MDPVGQEEKFLDYDPTEQFVDYDPADMARMDAAEQFVDHDPTAIVEKQSKLADAYDVPVKTPEELRAMSTTERMEYAESLNTLHKFQQSKGFVKGLASGVSLGASEYIPGMDKQEDDLLHSVGELAGSIAPIEGIYSLLGKPLVKLAAKSPYAKNALLSLARITGFGLSGATYESAKDVIKTGEAPSIDDVVKHGASWAAFDGALQVAGKAISWTSKLRELSKYNKNLSQQAILDDVIAKLSKENINPEANPVEYAERAEQLLDEQLPKEPEVPLKEQPDSAITAKQEANIAEVKPDEVVKPTQEQPQKATPIRVETPAEDVGKKPKEILAKHVQTGKSPWKVQLPSVQQATDAIETQLYNRYAPLKALGADEASIMNKPRELAELAKGYSTAAEATLRMSQYDAATGKMIGPSFEEIFLPKRLKELTGSRKLARDDLDIYLAAKTSLERQQIGQRSAMSTDASEAFIKEHGEFKPIADDLYTFGRNQINNLVHNGLVSREGADAMFDMYKSHVPLYRVMPEELSTTEKIRKGLTGNTPAGDAPQTPGASNLNVKQPIKRAHGSEKTIISPTESIVKNAYAFESASMRNRAMRATGRGLEKNGYNVSTVNAPKMSKQQIADSLAIPLDELESLGDVDAIGEATQFLNPEQPRGKLRWYEDGKLYEVNAPRDIIDAVSGLSPEQSNVVMRFARGWKKIFSAGVVLQPGTMMKLSGMDMFVSTLQSKYPEHNALIEPVARMVYDYPRMFFNILGKGELFQDYMHSGAAQTSLQGLNREMLESMTDTFTNAKKRNNTLLKDTLMLPITIPKKIVKGLAKTSQVLGDVPRLLEFERSKVAALKRGATKPEAMAQAAFDAFEVSVPYGRRGASSSLRTMYDLIPFTNTIVNSNVSLAKALDPRNKNFMRTMATATSYLTMPTVALYLKNRNDPRYQALPQDDKDRNLYIYNTDDPNEEPVKIRKLWQYGYLFQTLPEHLAEYAIQRDPKAFNGLAKNFEHEFSPATILSFSSAIHDGRFDPTKFLEGSRIPLIPERQKRIDAELQATSNTSEVAKSLARWFKISPIYIDHIVSSTGGGLGANAIRCADEMMYATGKATDKRPASQAADSIFFGTFFGRGPSKRNEYVNKFYDYVDKYETMKGSAKVYRENGEDDKADALMEQYVDTTKMRQSFSKYYKAIDAIRKEHPDDLNGVQKRAELNSIYQDFTELAKEYVKSIEDEQKRA